jgi:hypothetical protein
VSQPDECPTEQFSWTWDPNGCLSIADPGVAVSSEDAGAAHRVDSGTTAPDASHEEVDSGHATNGNAGVGDAAAEGAQ